jgi:hypothetical protein
MARPRADLRGGIPERSSRRGMGVDRRPKPSVGLVEVEASADVVESESESESESEG